MASSGSSSSEHGYSGKPLVKKLGLKPDMAALAISPPPNFSDLMDDVAVAASDTPPKSGSYDYLHVFVRTAADLQANLRPLEARLAQGGMIWVSWPKKTSPMFVDLTEDGIRAEALPMGLVDVKVCAVDQDWSGLKLMRRKQPSA
ncbi:MAG: DUF3052 family protein [Hyphomonadaceae bacterium]